MGATTSPIPVSAPVAIRNILFATDFSSSSEAALPFALCLARRYGATLFCTHVLAPEPRYDWPLERESDAMNAPKQEAIRRLAAAFESNEMSGIVHAPILRTGPFWPTMQEIIADHQIDFIVTGTHGRGGFRKLFLGSKAELIFRNATCPVLTVGLHAQASAANNGNRRIVFATDCSSTSLKALPYAVSLAASENARLTVVHAVAPAPAAIEAVVVPIAEAELVEDAKQRLNRILTQAALPSSPEVVVTCGPVVDAILTAAVQRNASMIVLGVRHKGALAAHVPWSIADGVVAHAPCPVLTVRGD